MERIGIASAIHHVGIGKLRISGYQEAMGKLPVFTARSSSEGTLKSKIEKLLVTEKVEALLCTDFESAIIATRVAYEQNIKIPEDLKIIGYINKDIAEYLTPSLSYIEQHPSELGIKAVEVLNQRISGDIPAGKFEEKIIATTMVHLESSKF